MMNNDVFAVAAGETENIKKFKEALAKMFCFEFMADEDANKQAVLYAKSYTEDLETEKRRPYVIKAAKELMDKYEVPVILGYYEGYQEPMHAIVEKYKNFYEAIDKGGIDAIFGKSSGQMGG